MALYDPYDTGYTDYFTRMMRAKAAQSLGFYRATRSFGSPWDDAMNQAISAMDPIIQKATLEVRAIASKMLVEMKDFSSAYKNAEVAILVVREANINYSNFLMTKLNAMQARHKLALDKWVAALKSTFVEDVREAYNAFHVLLQEMYVFQNTMKSEANLPPDALAKKMPDEGMFDKAKGFLYVAIAAIVAVTVLPKVMDMISKKKG